MKVNSFQDRENVTPCQALAKFAAKYWTKYCAKYWVKHQPSIRPSIQPSNAHVKLDSNSEPCPQSDLKDLELSS